MARARIVRSLREIALVGGLYGLYTLTRNLLGEDATLAERNAHRVVALERWLHVDVEHGLQRALDHHTWMRVLNAFYGIAHFVVTIAVLVWVFRRRSADRYARWRSAIVVTTLVALVGYVSFPLAPPRLLDIGIFDSLEVYGSPWSYDSGPISRISNQYAAMPSLHVAWALWCGIVLWVESRRSHPRVRTWVRTAAIAHPAMTNVVVVATGNHFVLDAVGGALVLALGLAASRRLHGRSTAPVIAPQDERRPTAAPPTAAARGSEAVVAPVDGDHVGRVVAAGRAGEVDGQPAEVGAGTPSA